MCSDMADPGLISKKIPWSHPRSVPKRTTGCPQTKQEEPTVYVTHAFWIQGAPQGEACPQEWQPGVQGEGMECPSQGTD